MTRTKPTEALSKILRAERIRFRQLKHDAGFQRDVQELEAIAKRLASAPSGRFPVSELSKLNEKDLLPTADEATFHEEAEHFKEKWGFQPRWNDKGGVELFMRSPVGIKASLGTREVIETTRRLKYHPDRDIDALEKHYRAIRKHVRAKKGRQPSARRRLRIEPQELRLKAREMQAKGLSLEQITKALFKRYKRSKKRWSPEQHPRYRDTFNKYIRPPFSLNADAAMKRADEELRQSHRREAAENRKLREQVRRLLQSSS